MVDTKWEWKERPLVMQLFQNGHYVASVPHEAMRYLEIANREQRLESLLISIRQEIDLSGIENFHPSIGRIADEIDKEIVIW